MAESKLFTVRPASKQARTDYKDTFRVYLSAASLLQVKVRVGELCQLETYAPANSSSSHSNGQGGGEVKKTAIAWTAAEKIHENIVQTSKQLQELYGLKLGDKVSISPASDPLADIETVRLEELRRNASTNQATAGRAAASPAARDLSDEERPHWEWALEHPLSKCEVVSLGLVFDVELKGASRRLRVAHIDSGSSAATNTIFKFTERSRVVIGMTDAASDDAASAPTDRLEVMSTGLDGLSPQLAMVNE
ncbi:hypothetical protein FQN49_008260, partial [Arthroderma sp. PD_2]